MQDNTKRTTRNLIIFTFVTIFAGWAGLWIDRQMPAGEQQGPGMLLWLVAPLATGLLLRRFAGDGWQTAGFRPALKRNLKWYAVSLLLYPAVVTIVLALGAAAGAISFPGLSPNTLGLFFQAVGIALIPALFKNIFEEFAWRGYLDPQLSSLPIHDFVAYAGVGLVWTAWHLPYWLGFLEPSVLASFSPYSTPVFILMAIPALIASSILYGEIRKITNSVWPLLLLHSVENALVLPLLLQDFISVESNLAFIFSPSMQSVLMLALIAALGIGLRQIRLRKSGQLQTELAIATA